MKKRLKRRNYGKNEELPKERNTNKKKQMRERERVKIPKRNEKRKN